MNLAQQFDLLGRRQLAVQEGIQLLRKIQVDLARTRSVADAWGFVAVLANVTIIPLNVIVNAFELKAANSAYQFFVRQIYARFGRSGSRIDGNAKTALSLLKQAITEELKRKAKTDLIPGVNILVGLAEDSLAAWQAVQLVNSGQREMSAIAADISRKISAAQREMTRLGIERAHVHERIDIRARTA